jgi:hypothetical protein
MSRMDVHIQMMGGMRRLVFVHSVLKAHEEVKVLVYQFNPVISNCARARVTYGMDQRSKALVGVSGFSVKPEFNPHGEPTYRHHSVLRQLKVP